MTTDLLPALVDELTGAVPTWRPGDEPIYLETVRDLGMPGSLTGPSRDVVAGDILDADATEEDAPRAAVEAPPTVPIPIRTRPPAAGGKKRRQPTARRAAS